MPTMPRMVTLTNASVDVLNAIRNSASVDYRNYVPVATPDADCIRAIGAVLMDYPALQNEFANTLINRIGRVLITSKMYSNPWSVFKKGRLDFGESVEEIFVDLAKPFQFNQEVAEEEVFKRENSDVSTAFHILNYKTFYKVTVSQQELSNAFLSIDGVTELIAKKIETLYTSANYDEFQVMKYLLARHILQGHLYPAPVGSITTANAKAIVSAIKGVSNDLEFLSPKYNLAKVYNSTDKRNQFIILNSKFDAMIDVEVLASAFNMNKAEFMGNRILVDSFGSLDIARLNQLFANDDSYVELSADELAALDAIPCVLVDKDYFMVFDKLDEMRSIENGQGLYWNYWYHIWRVVSASPYANAIVFSGGEPTITNMYLTGATNMANVTIVNGSAESPDLTATVDIKSGAKRNGYFNIAPVFTTTDFAPESVTYVSDSDYVTVDARGKATYSVPTTVVTDTTATVTVTSTYDSTVTADVNITFDIA